ncbi:hypothetical protein M513_07991 [Trichuris suis]|uniref:ZP domain-containing protein n=1 Tax=Trichuris suis TaxID=68888 RepID=A0A085M1J5_9BILA|nr:hypothetical protein M513_07991 [Trichuris suis]
MTFSSRYCNMRLLNVDYYAPRGIRYFRVALPCYKQICMSRQSLRKENLAQVKMNIDLEMIRVRKRVAKKEKENYPPTEIEAEKEEILVRRMISLIVQYCAYETSPFIVKSVTCKAGGMEIELKPSLPKPSSGMWDLEVEGHPHCPNASKKDIGAGYRFTINYADRYLCGVEPVAWFTPSWISYAEVTLLLKDDNNTMVADSVSCLYNTRVEASSVTFRGEVTNEQLRYSGTVDEEGTDIEGFADSSQAISMEFLDEFNERLSHQNVKLGDPIKLVLSVSNNNLVQQILPETCYFSSSSSPEEHPRKGHTLVFVRRSCFNSKNPMVRAILPKMDRNQNGSSYELHFPAFYFTNYGRSLYVHCTILACVGNQKQCEPKPGCFGTNRKRRHVGTLELEPSTAAGIQKDLSGTREVQLSRYVVVQNGNGELKKGRFAYFDIKRCPAISEKNELDAELASMAHADAICLNFSVFVAIAGSMVIVIISLLIVVAWLLGRQGKDKSSKLANSYAVITKPADPNSPNVLKL